MSGENGTGLEALERDLEVLKDFATVKLEDGDLLVVTVDHRMTDAAKEHLESELWRLIFASGKQRVKPVILEGCSLAVLRGGEA